MSSKLNSVYFFRTLGVFLAISAAIGYERILRPEAVSPAVSFLRTYWKYFGDWGHAAFWAYESILMIIFFGLILMLWILSRFHRIVLSVCICVVVLLWMCKPYKGLDGRSLGQALDRINEKSEFDPTLDSSFSIEKTSRGDFVWRDLRRIKLGIVRGREFVISYQDDRYVVVDEYDWSSTFY